MSHFAVLVLFSPQENPEAAIERLLAPYSENLEVPEYLEKCGCYGLKASIEAGEEADRAAPLTIEEYRKSYWTMSPDNRPEWSVHIQDWSHARQFALDSHPMKDQFDPECEDCHGTGSYLTTYNPQSKWDWWQIGGRWTGELDGDYDPRQDIENQEWCNICDGTGNRSDMEYWADPANVENTRVSANLSALEVALTGKSSPPSIPAHYVRVHWCNGCSGKGMRTKWPTNWTEYKGDIKPANQIALSFTPYAIVTPDGEWVERGKMGWFGMSSNEKGDDEWRKIYEETLEKHLDCMAAIVDCHI